MLHSFLCTVLVSYFKVLSGLSQLLKSGRAFAVFVLGVHILGWWCPLTWLGQEMRLMSSTNSRCVGLTEHQALVYLLMLTSQEDNIDRCLPRAKNYLLFCFFYIPPATHS